MDAVLAESPFFMRHLPIWHFPPMPILMVSGSCEYRTEAGKKHSMKEYILTPVNAAIVVGLIMFIFQLRFPAPVDNAVQGMSSLTTPMAMLYVGNDFDKKQHQRCFQ